MPKQLFDAILTILGGIIAGLVGIFVGDWQRKRDARNQFLISMSLIKGGMPVDCMFDSFRNGSLPDIKEAILRVKPFLNKSQVTQLSSLFSDYQDIDEDDLADRNESQAFRNALAEEGKTVPDKPSDILRSYLDRMYSVAE